MTAEKEKIDKIKRAVLDKLNDEDYCNLNSQEYVDEYLEEELKDLFEVGKSEAISDFVEKIKELLNDWCYKDCMNSACQRDMFNKIDKLAKEQFSGETK